MERLRLEYSGELLKKPDPVVRRIDEVEHCPSLSISFGTYFTKPQTFPGLSFNVRPSILRISKEETALFPSEINLGLNAGSHSVNNDPSLFLILPMSFS